MITERDFQRFIHNIEEGLVARRLRLLLLPGAILLLTTFFIWRFHGISTAEGMDQAQIAREIARGHGFSTRFIRPLAIREFEKRRGSFPTGLVPDIYHAPLNPFLNSLVFRLRRRSWQMSTLQTLYAPDLLVAEVSLFFLILSLALLYVTARLLFSPRLATLGTGLVVCCYSLWEFALSGLPQMLMLFLFSGCLYTLVRALDAAIAEKPATRWFAAAGALFGLLGLAHGLTIWIFAGALLHAGLAYRPRGKQALVMLATFSVVYAPWLFRNWLVCGNPFGLACFSALSGISGSEETLMRSLTLPIRGLDPQAVGAKLQSQLAFQLEHLYPLLGMIPVAPLFFVALLHRFRRPQAAAFRWCLVSLAAGAALGMAAFGLGEGELQPNNLYILFVPLFSFYGLAFVLSLWDRLFRQNRAVLRVGMIAVLYLISAFPLLDALNKGTSTLFHWPPYAPPYISLLNKWTSEDEIIVSDMPWAVAWYADRKCVWLPATVGNFMYLNQTKLLGGPLVGIYLTPVSCDVPYESVILNGEYKEWAPLILAIAMGRPPNLPAKFPLHAATRLPLNRECIYYSDRDRWSEPGN